MSEPARTTVVDSLTQFGGTLSMSEASRAYGVPVGTIKRWAKERREGKEPAEVVKLATVPPPLPEPTSRARETMKGREVRALEIGRALGDAARDDLRTTGGNLIRYLRQQTQLAVDGPPADVNPLDWRPPDMMQVAAAARSLDALLSRAADVLAFDRTTQAPGDVDQLTDAAAVRAEVLRRKRG